MIQRKTRLGRSIWIACLLAVNGAFILAQDRDPVVSNPLEPLPIPNANPRKLAPYVGTPPNVIEQMLKLADLKAGETLYDLGCGDGRILIMAVEKFKARAVGVELNDRLYKEAVRKVKAKGLEDRARVIHGDLLEVNPRPADVVTLYLLTSGNERVRPRLEKYLRSGTRVVSHDFMVRRWKPTKTRNYMDRNGISHNLYLYTLPQAKRRGSVR